MTYNVDFIVNNSQPTPAIEMVDLGLSVKWAKCNLGANSITDYGNYYAWGELETKNYYYWVDETKEILNYKYGKDLFHLTKYCPSNKSSRWGGEGLPDNILSLELVDDIAYQTNKSWRIPSKSDFEELKTLANKWVTINGINGRVFSKNREEILYYNGFNENTMLFLPASGWKNRDIYENGNTIGYYWTSTLYEEQPEQAWEFDINHDNTHIDPRCERCFGISIRPVLIESDK